MFLKSLSLKTNSSFLGYKFNISAKEYIVSIDELLRQRNFDEGQYFCMGDLDRTKVYSESTEIKFNSLNMHMYMKSNSNNFLCENFGKVLTNYLRSEKNFDLTSNNFSVKAYCINTSQTDGIYKYGIKVYQRLKDTFHRYSESTIINKLRDSIEKMWKVKEILYLSIVNTCEETYLNTSADGYFIKFDRILVGEISTSTRLCLDGLPVGKANCTIGKYGYPNRTDLTFRSNDECYGKTEDDKKTLKNISLTNLNEKNIGKEISTALKLVKDSSLTKEDCIYTSLILDNIANTKIKLNEREFKDILELPNEILKAPFKTIDSAQKQVNSSSLIINAIEKIASRAQMVNKTFQFHTPRASFYLVEGNNLSFNTLLHNKSLNDDLMEENSVSINTFSSPKPLKNSISGIYFREYFDLRKKARVFMAVYSKTNFFKISEKKVPIGNVIKSSITDFDVLNLSPGIVIVFKPYEKYKNIKNNRTCVFWDKKRSNWSTDGCKFKYIDNDRIFCECSHFTNFAVIMDFDGIYTENLILSTITKIGLILSTVCLGFIVVSFLAFK